MLRLEEGSINQRKGWGSAMGSPGHCRWQGSMCKSPVVGEDFCSSRDQRFVGNRKWWIVPWNQAELVSKARGLGKLRRV